GGPYKVFTPFDKACLQLPVIGPHPQLVPPPRGNGEAVDHLGVTVSDLNLLPDHLWAHRVVSHWSISEDAAMDRLNTFASRLIGAYTEQRDRPDRDGTSRLSPYLQWGLISPRQIRATLTEARRAAS